MRALRKYFSRVTPLIYVALALVIVATATGYSKKAIEKSGYLGVSIDNLDRLEKEALGISYGILVTEVVEDSPAEKAGLQEEDVIQKYNGKKIRRPEDLVRHVSQTEPETKVDIVLNRNGKEKRVKVTIGAKEKKVWAWKNDDKHSFVFVGEKHGYLGVQLHEMDANLAPYFPASGKGGALVLEVMEESAAEEAGIKSGDVIVALDGSPVESPKDLQKKLKDTEAGDEVECTIIRKGKKQSIKVELDESPMSSHSGFKMGGCYPGGSHITVPEINMEEFHMNRDRIKEDMKDLNKEIQIKVQSCEEPTDI